MKTTKVTTPNAKAYKVEPRSQRVVETKGHSMGAVKVKPTHKATPRPTGSSKNC